MSNNPETQVILDFIVVTSGLSKKGVFTLDGIEELSQKGYVPVGGCSVSGGVAAQSFALYKNNFK